jgi:hypothetical protein
MTGQASPRVLTLRPQRRRSGPSSPRGGFAVEIKNNCYAIYEFGLYGAAVMRCPWTPIVPGGTGSP